MQITIRHQTRKTLAFQWTPNGAVVLAPHGVDPDSAVVQQFVADALAKLPPPPSTNAGAALTVEEIKQLVAEWSVRLQVNVNRVQIRAMRNKWGSVSTAGTLTLAAALLALPVPLVEYVVVHELLHLKFPDHRKGWQVSMGIYLPDWRTRSEQLTYYPDRS
ncbi:MAG: M48 family metallopeptidase [Caldilineaceae bacterium]|nr:M48 family metallopeptidase [Caldilineaceae bacterium]